MSWEHWELLSGSHGAFAAVTLGEIYPEFSICSNNI